MPIFPLGICEYLFNILCPVSNNVCAHLNSSDVGEGYLFSANLIHANIEDGGPCLSDPF
jgi:hypothetical protein